MAAAFFLSGCVANPTKTPAKAASKAASKAPSADTTLWPALPDRPRFKHMGSLRSARDVVLETDEQRLDREMMGRKGKPEVSDAPVMDKPSGIAVWRGELYVAEPSAAAVTVFSLSRRKMFRFGLRPPNEIRVPRSVAVDEQGMVYVLDTGRREVMVFDNLGLFIRSFGVSSGFTNPVAAAPSPDGKTVYVVDRGGPFQL